LTLHRPMRACFYCLLLAMACLGTSVWAERVANQEQEDPPRRIKPPANCKVDSGHLGRAVDCDGRIGDAIRATGGAGRVVISGWGSKAANCGTGYGRMVVIDSGSFFTIYAHLSRSLVSVGQRVGAGATIGKMGNTGRVIRGRGGDGSHLHKEVIRKCPGSKGGSRILCEALTCGRR
jgi:murein DD-endopeptidase MepM/ murein hydrolase activator NlpD